MMVARLPAASEQKVCTKTPYCQARPRRNISAGFETPPEASTVNHFRVLRRMFPCLPGLCRNETYHRQNHRGTSRGVNFVTGHKIKCMGMDGILEAPLRNFRGSGFQRDSGIYPGLTIRDGGQKTAKMSKNRYGDEDED